MTICEKAAAKCEAVSEPARRPLLAKPNLRRIFSATLELGSVGVYRANSSSNALASFKSAVSKPSVNQL